MRQAEDPTYQSLLGQVRAGTLITEDCNLLNKKVIFSILTPDLENAVIVVRSNELRHHINRVRIESMARSRSQRIYIFPAQHSRIASASSSTLNVENLLQQVDKSTKVPFPGLFLYTLGMPISILANICSKLGLVNGTQGTTVGILVNSNGLSFHVYSSKKNN